MQCYAKSGVDRWYFTSVLRRKVVQGTVVLLQGLAEVVGSQTVLTHLVVDAAQVVQVERGQALP